MPQRKDSLTTLNLPKVSILSKSEKISMMFYEIKKTKLDRVLVKDKDKLIGVVTLRDVFMKLASKKFSNISPSSLSVAAFTSERLTYTDAKSTLGEAVNIMARETISALPVFNGEGTVLGLLTKNLLIYLLASELKGKVENYVIKTGYSTIPETSLSSLINEILKDRDMREFAVVQNSIPSGVVGEKELSTFLFNYLSNDQIHHMKSALRKYVANDIMTLVTEQLKSQDPVQKASSLIAGTNLVIYPVIQEGVFSGVIRRRELFNQLLT
ncbi:MAG: CBS domain-containing protein [Nitrososphaeria archaeon]